MTDDFAPLAPNELWLCHFSCAAWSGADRWARYFGSAEDILGASITHLDKDDPVRRRVKAGALTEVSEYVTFMGKRDESRWVFGKMESIGVEFAVRHYRDVRGWPNSINWYFPAGFADSASGALVIRRLFDCGNTTLSAFYAYGDTRDQVSSKKKESGAVNIQSELIGVFWLSYFDTLYVSFIGRERFDELQGISVKFDGGATLELGTTPSSVPHERRADAEAKLGRKLFVEPKDMSTKRQGEYALTFEQLRA